MRHLPILSEPHGERSLKSSRQLELYNLGCRVSGGVQPQEMAPVLLAEYGVEERKGGTGGRGGAHPVRLSELPMKFLPNRLFAPAPLKRKVDGGESDEGHVGNRERESADGRDDESGCAGPRALKNIIGDLRLVKAIQAKVAVARFRGDVPGQGYYMTLHTQLRATMEKAFRTYGCGITAPIRSLFGFLKTTRTGSERQSYFRVTRT